MDSNLQDHTIQALRSRRPLLHHLNADSSWLLQLPLSQPQPNSRSWYNILIDPWLSGSQSDIASWFSTQRHAEACAVPSIAALESLLRTVETISRTYKPSTADAVTVSNETNDEALSLSSCIDVIAISHEFTDHCHRDTLLQCSPEIPVIAPRKAAGIVRAWKHFHTVHDIPAFPPPRSKDWRDLQGPSLPAWLRIARLTSPRDIQYFHSALVFLFSQDDDDGGGGGGGDFVEAVLYTPHGYLARDLQCVTEMSPPVRSLAFLHGLHNVTMPGKKINYGAFNGLAAQKILKSRYWIGTHDEVKIPRGLIKYVLRRKAYSIQDVIIHEQANKTPAAGSVQDEKPAITDEIPYIDLGNGRSLVLQ